MKNYISGFKKSTLFHYAWIIFLVSFEFFLIGSIITFSPTDPSWFYHATVQNSYKNLFGFCGSYGASLLLYLFGRGTFFLVGLVYYAIFLYWHLCITKKIKMYTEWDRSLGLIFGFFTLITFCQVYAFHTYDFTYSGGVVGYYMCSHLLNYFDLLTAKIVIWTLLLTCFILVSRCSYMPFIEYIIRFISYCCHPLSFPARAFQTIFTFFKMLFFTILFFIKRSFDAITGKSLQNVSSSIVEFEQEDNIDEEIEKVVEDLFWHDYIDDADTMQSIQLDVNHVPSDDLIFQHPVKDSLLKNTMLDEDQSMLDEETSEMKDVQPVKQLDGNTKIKADAVEYQLPFVAVKKSDPHILQEKQDVLAMQAKTLEEKLQQFDIAGSVVSMHVGPVVTLFEYQPDIKVKVSRILALEDDLAMALKALSIRIIAPIPGRSVVGFEVSNQHRQDVIMAKILQSQSFKKYQGALPMIFGQDTLGNDIIADLAKMPHLLIAGSTGSGKSVALNAMLVSLLCALKPSELKLIIIDPKRLEFAAYDGIAHLLFPIVTETKKAIPVLKWVVQTMEKRYEIMAKYGVRNLADYKKAAEKDTTIESMSYIVVIIDELADLMMTAGKAVEDSIARIAQMARAAGIHMIIATQRPSVDVITGMIKVNFPNRVAFKVTSKIDSRTILDVGGAEKLLGRGDMLFLDATKSHLVRVHGAYISDQEIHDVVHQITKQCKVQYLDITQEFNQLQSDDFLDGDDALYQEILEFIQDLDEVSISMLQRRFRIGYNRSARIISILESKGVIMSVDGGKTRRVIK